ncbi:MAG: transposase [Limisphaerales bacterium]
MIVLRKCEGEQGTKEARHREEQIITILKQGDSGVKAAKLCRQHGITEATYYHWKAKYGGMDVSDAKKRKQLEEENRKFKHAVANLILDKIALGDVLSKSSRSLAVQRKATSYLMGEVSSERTPCVQAAQTGSFHQTLPEPGKRARPAAETATAGVGRKRLRFGCRQLWPLLVREGWRINHKRVPGCTGRKGWLWAAADGGSICGE